MAGTSPSPRSAPSLRLFLAVLVGVTGPTLSWAQLGHPLPPSQRPLHQRLASADAVARVRIEAVGPGRIRVHADEVLQGSLEPEFEIKRSPSRPPPLAEGDHAVLLLRGARSPYILADEPREILVLDGEEVGQPHLEGVRRLLASRDEPQRWVRVYLDWLEGNDLPLAELALRSLLDPQAPFLPFPDDVIQQRVSAVLDPTRSERVRRASAALVARSPEGSRVLAGRLLSLPGPPEAVWLSLALRAALAGQNEDALPLLMRALRHPEVTTRHVGVGAALLLSQVHPEVEKEVGKLARDDPDEQVRRDAGRVLHALEGLAENSQADGSGP